MDMIKKIFAVLTLTWSFQTFCFEEVQKIEQLIAITEKQLDKQRTLKNEMELFERQKETFLNGEQTIPQATSMVRTATRILTTITDNHLQYLFSSEYLEELALFTSLGAKKAPSRP